MLQQRSQRDALLGQALAGDAVTVPITPIRVLAQPAFAEKACLRLGLGGDVVAVSVANHARPVDASPGRDVSGWAVHRVPTRADVP